MNIEAAQGELRRVYFGGAVGALVAGVLWLTAAAVSTWFRASTGMLVLFGGGVLIFPVTVLILKVLGRSTKLSPGNTLDQLATQIALTVPLGFPLAVFAYQRNAGWYYPAAMIVVGAHYLPFVFLYGLKHYAVLGGAMVAGGLMLAMYLSGHVALGAWLTGALLIGFSAVLRMTVAAEGKGGAA